MATRREKFIDYYHVLRVWPTASDDAIKKAYFSLAKIYHPDVVGKDGESKDDDIDFKTINEAYAVLSDPVRRREFDEWLKSQKQAVPSGKSAVQEADKRSAQLAYEQARTAMKHHRYDKAVVLLKSALKYDATNPAYFSWYGFCLAALNTRLHEGRDMCKKALEMEFYNADYHANLGFVYHRAGLKGTANEAFQEALKWDPTHALALKYLQTGAGAQRDGILKRILDLFRGKAPRKAGERAT